MCVCCVFKTIVWFFKSSQQRRFSRVVPECLFAQCKGQQMEHYWRPASDFCYWSAITVKSLYCIRGSYCSPQGGKRRGVCTVVYVTTNQGQGLTHTTHTYTHTKTEPLLLVYSSFWMNFQLWTHIVNAILIFYFLVFSFLSHIWQKVLWTALTHFLNFPLNLCAAQPRCLLK